MGDSFPETFFKYRSNVSIFPNPSKFVNSHGFISEVPDICGENITVSLQNYY